MKGRSLFSLTISLTILCTCSLEVFAQSRQTTQGLHDNNYPTNTQAQSTRRIPFQICGESQSWVRPSETEQIARTKSPRYGGHGVNSRFWTDNIFLLTFYGAAALNDPIFMSGLWTLIKDAAWAGQIECHKPAAIQKINSGQLADVWLLQHRAIRIEWQGNRYIIVVTPVERGVQFIQFPRVERQSPLILKVVAENGTELATLSELGMVATARLPNVRQATGERSPSPSQQTTTGRSPSSNQQNPQRQTQINGDDTIVYNNIVCSGKTRNFLGQESPASCRSKEADSRLIFNSITWERQADSSIKVEMKVFNKGSAEALIEIYDSKNRLVDLKIIDGNKPPTGLMDSGIDMFTRFPISLFNQYPLTDSRKNLNEQEFSDNKKNSIIIPSGGSLKITKSSNQAFRYNAALLSLELALLGLGDPKFAEDETVKQFVKRFAQEAYFSRTSKATINLFKSEPSTQAMFRMDVVDPKKAAELLQQFVQYTVTIESDPSKNPFIGAFLDVYKDVGNIGLEIALDKFILPGLGTFAKNTRIAGSTLNTFARAADLYYATAAGEKATITLEDADKLRN
jgi:hypothetical protein